MKDLLDLRSDTMTLPSPAMRKAMARAKVGDAQRGEDPTVRELEEYAASLFGKEAGFFVPSGTMGNLSAVAAWTRPGDVVVASAASHIAGRESPGVSNLASVTVFGINTPGGVFRPEDVARALDEVPRQTRSRVRLVTAENTHNAGGGTVFPISCLRRIRAICRKAEIPLHIDGSRIFNASVASGVPVNEYGRICHSLMFCLSKGLGAPVGSVLVGTRDFIEEARSVGLRLGGGMRQAGIVAAGGLFALRHNIERLAEDHENAQILVRALEEMPDMEVVNAPVETNIVIFRWRKPSVSLPEFKEFLAGRGLLLDDRNYPLLRTVTHLGIGRREIARTVRALREVMDNRGGRP
jgi:threonine aldolase